MKKNVGTLDKVVRILISLVVVILYFLGVLSGTLAIILLIFSGILILTSLISFCPLYIPFKINSSGKK